MLLDKITCIFTNITICLLYIFVILMILYMIYIYISSIKEDEKRRKKWAIIEYINIKNFIKEAEKRRIK